MYEEVVVGDEARGVCVVPPLVFVERRGRGREEHRERKGRGEGEKKSKKKKLFPHPSVGPGSFASTLQGSRAGEGREWSEFENRKNQESINNHKIISRRYGRRYGRGGGEQQDIILSPSLPFPLPFRPSRSDGERRTHARTDGGGKT